MNIDDGLNNNVVSPPLRMDESSLAVEHRIFFGEYYRNIYEKNKMIFPKNDRRRRGQHQDQGTVTEYEKAIVYEAYEVIFSEERFNVEAGQVISLVVTQGNMSGNLVLRMKIQDSNGEAIMQDLCLYQSEVAKKGLTQQVASSIIKMPHGEQHNLAFVVSFERIYNTDNLVIRVAEIQRYDHSTMGSFRWEPLSPSGAGYGSLHHIEHTIFLLKKNNGKYMKLQNFEVLNTEVRALLFKHSYGYDMSILDFGKLQSLQSTSFQLAKPQALSEPENA